MSTHAGSRGGTPRTRGGGGRVAKTPLERAQEAREKAAQRVEETRQGGETGTYGQYQEHVRALQALKSAETRLTKAQEVARGVDTKLKAHDDRIARLERAAEAAQRKLDEARAARAAYVAGKQGGAQEQQPARATGRGRTPAPSVSDIIRQRQAMTINQESARQLDRRDITLRGAPDVHWLRALYGDENLRQALGDFSLNKLRAAARQLNIPSGGTHAVLLQRIIDHVQSVPMSESIRLANEQTKIDNTHG